MLQFFRFQSLKKFVPIRLLHVWDQLISSLWFVPAIMVLAAVGLAILMPSIDSIVNLSHYNDLSGLWISSEEGARAILSTIAGSMITVAGVVFSITIVALTLASSQFGPRLLRNFMRDTFNQVVLGSFIATFVYCISILKTVATGRDSQFMPHLSVLISILLALGCMALLIYFIHHVSLSIQADQIIKKVVGELHDAIDRLYPMQVGFQAKKVFTENDIEVEVKSYKNSAAILTRQDGYLLSINGKKLFELAKDHEWIIHILPRPGAFLTRTQIMANLYSNQPLTKELLNKVQSSFSQGVRKTPIQDVEFAVNQIVEVALRALSPGINDPFTAINCIDQLSAILCRCASVEFPTRCRVDENGSLRIVAKPETFESIFLAAVQQIRQNAGSHSAIRIRLLESMQRMIGAVTRPEYMDLINEQAGMVVEDLETHVAVQADRDDILAAHKQLLDKMDEKYGKGARHQICMNEKIY